MYICTYAHMYISTYVNVSYCEIYPRGELMDNRKQTTGISASFVGQEQDHSCNELQKSS